MTGRSIVGRIRVPGGLLTWLIVCAFQDVHFERATRITPKLQPDLVAARRDGADRMTVQVRVNGQGPYPFVIDTGADRTVISREIAAELKLSPGDPVLLHGTGGADMTPTAQIGVLAVGAREFYEMTAPTLGAGDLGAKGMLGIDTLSSQRMVMDFRRNTLSVEPSKRRDDDDGGDVIVVHARSRYGQLILVDASIGGQPLAVIVDSGAQNTIGNLALQHRIMGLSRAALAPETVVISVSGRTTPGRFANLPRVRIGGVELKNLPIAFADLHTFAKFGMNDAAAMLLGMDVLRHFDRVVVDFGRRQVSFELPAKG